MKVVGLLSGRAPVMLRYQVGETMSTAGVPVEIAAANGAGVVLCATTTCEDAAGVTVDTATYSTTQGTGANSAEALVTVIVNPDAILEALLSGGATAGTALTLYDVTTASAGGVDVNTGDDWTNPEFDEGYVWGYDGANAGAQRKITATTTAKATVTVPFDVGIAVGDNFLRAPLAPMQTATAQLTSNLAEVDASIAVATGGAFRTLKIIGEDSAHEGTTTSKAWLYFGDHFLNANP